MREDAFRAFLVACTYSSNAVASRLSRCRGVERRLHADLDRLDLSDDALAAMRDRLAAMGHDGSILANEMNAVRSYRRFAAGEVPKPLGSVQPCTPSKPAASRSQFVVDAPVAKLLALYGEVLDELRDRDVLRTANAPVGDYAEWLFARAFGWKRAANSTAGYDAVDEATGQRIQIKGRRLGPSSRSRQLSVIRQLDGGFDALAAVLFNPDMTVVRAAIVPATVVTRVAQRTDYVNGWRMMLPDSLWLVAEVEDVTVRLRQAAMSGG